MYVYNYAIPNGYVEERVLTNTPLNIFNANSKLDFFIAKKYFNEYYEEQLKKQDWLNILNLKERQNFLKYLKELKYGGFFNYEDEENDAPSLGLFKKECSKIVDRIELDQIRNSKEFELMYLKEKRRFYNDLRLCIYKEKYDLKIDFKKFKFLKKNEIKKNY